MLLDDRRIVKKVSAILLQTTACVRLPVVMGLCAMAGTVSHIPSHLPLHPRLDFLIDPNSWACVQSGEHVSEPSGSAQQRGNLRHQLADGNLLWYTGLRIPVDWMQEAER